MCPQRTENERNCQPGGHSVKMWAYLKWLPESQLPKGRISTALQIKLKRVAGNGSDRWWVCTATHTTEAVVPRYWEYSISLRTTQDPFWENAPCTENTMAGTGKCYRASAQQKQVLLLPTLSRRNRFRQEDNMSNHMDRKKNDVTPMCRSRKIQKGS